jgi:hypothetical protein
MYLSILGVLADFKQWLGFSLTQWGFTESLNLQLPKEDKIPYGA